MINFLKQVRAALLACILASSLACGNELGEYFDLEKRVENLENTLQVQGLWQKPTLSPPSPSSKERLESALQDLRYLKRLKEFDPTILHNSPLSSSLNFKVLDEKELLSLNFFYSEKPADRELAYQDIKGKLLEILDNTANASFDFPQTLRILSRPKLIELNVEFQDVAIRDILKDSNYGLEALENVISLLIKYEATKAEKDKLTEAQKKPLRLYKYLAGFFYDYKAIEKLLKDDLCHVETLNPASKEDRFRILRRIQTQGELLKDMIPWTFSLVSDCPSLELLKDLRNSLSHLEAKKVEKLLSDEKEVTDIFTGLIEEQKSLYEKLQEIYNVHPLKKVPSTLRLKSARKKAEQEAKTIWEGLKQYSFSSSNSVRSEDDWASLQALLRLLKPSSLPLNNNIIDLIDNHLSNSEKYRIYIDPRFKRWSDIIQNSIPKNFEEFIEALKANCLPVELPQGQLRNLHKDLQTIKKMKDKAYSDNQIEEAKRLTQELNKIRKHMVFILMGRSDQEFENPSEQSEMTNLPDFTKWDNLIQTHMAKTFEDFIKALKSKNSSKQPLPISELEIIEFHKNLKAKDRQVKQAHDSSQTEEAKSLGEEREELQAIFAYKLMGSTEEEAKEIRKTCKKINELKGALRNYQTGSEPHKEYGIISKKFKKFLSTKEINSALETLDDEIKDYLGVRFIPKAYNWQNEPGTLEQWFHHILNIPIQGKKDKKAHRLAKIKEMLESIEFIRETSGIKTTVELEGYKDWLQQSIEGKALLLQQVARDLNMSAAETAINELNHSLKKFLSMHNKQFAYTPSESTLFGSHGSKIFWSTVDEIKKKLNDFPKKYFKPKELESLQQTILKILDTKLTQLNDKSQALKEIEITSEMRKKIADNSKAIEELLGLIPDLKNNKISQLLIQKYETINSKVNNIYNILSEEEGSEIYKNFVALAEEYLKELQELPPEAFCKQSQELSLQELEEEKKEIIESLKEALFDQTISRKRQALRRYKETQDVLQHPRLVTPYLDQKKIEELIWREGKNKRAVYEFLISTFYEQLKSVLDYPELSSLQKFRQVRNYFSHPTPYERSLIVIDGKHPDFEDYINNHEATIVKELTILAVNVKFILEEACRQLESTVEQPADSNLSEQNNNGPANLLASLPAQIPFVPIDNSQKKPDSTQQEIKDSKKEI